MANSLNLNLTNDLKKFISEQSGDDSLYSTPSEYVRDLIRKDKERKEAAELRKGILEGYSDVIAGRTRKFSGDLLKDLKGFIKENG